MGLSRPRLEKPDRGIDRFDPRQKSIFGPEHEKEIQEQAEKDAPPTRWPEGAEL